MNRVFERFRDVCRNPRVQLDLALGQGRKVVGVMPYFCPEELVYAAGMLPFGLWGATMKVSESKRYFPAFICSMLHTTLEMGIRGELNGLSAVMIPISCDSLKVMGANWQYSVPDIPVINVAYAQNRRMEAGTEFTRSQLVKIRRQLEQIAEREITDADLAEAVRVYNENRTAVLEFCAAAALHPEKISAEERAVALKAGYFMDRAEHTGLLREAAELLRQVKSVPHRRHRIVTTGIMAEPEELLRILDDCGFSIAADQVASESVSCRTLTPITEDPLRGLAERYGQIEGCSVLFDPDKNRGRQLVELVRETGAEGVIWFMYKFCDPEEYDYVPVRKMLEEAGIPLLTVETDQQMTSFEKARSAAEAFAELLD